MTIFNVKNSSLTNPVYIPIHCNVEKHIVSFLPHKDQVIFSQVSTIAYRCLSNNEYFKNLFEIKYSSLKNNERVYFNFNDLCNKHPKSFWKVICCVLQTGQINFNPEFLNEARLHDKNRFKMEVMQADMAVLKNSVDAVKQAA